MKTNLSRFDNSWFNPGRDFLVRTLWHFANALFLPSPLNPSCRLKVAILRRSARKQVAEAFYLTGNIEKYGSSYIRIRKELQDYPDVSLDVAEIGGGLLVTFKQNEGVSGGVSGGVDEILNYIRMNPGVKTTEIAAALGISQRTLERWLKQLKDAKKIIFKGAPKSGGYFVVTEAEVHRGR